MTKQTTNNKWPESPGRVTSDDVKRTSAGGVPPVKDPGMPHTPEPLEVTKPKSAPKPSSWPAMRETLTKTVLPMLLPTLIEGAKRALGLHALIPTNRYQTDIPQSASGKFADILNVGQKTPAEDVNDKWARLIAWGVRAIIIAYLVEKVGLAAAIGAAGLI